MRFMLKAAAMLASATIAPAAEAKVCAPAPLLAMTYNIRLDTPSDGPNAWAHRRVFFIGQIATTRPDLVGLQEVLPNQKQDLELALADYAFVGSGRDGGLTGEASPLGINRRQFRISAHGMFWLSPTPARPSLGWDAAYRRVATWAHLRRRADGLRLLVINTHWDNQGAEARRQSGLMLRRWISANLEKGERLILMGDFNATTDEASIAQLLNPSADGPALSDARTKAGAARFGPDYSFNAFQLSPSAHEARLIDHVLIGPRLAVRYHGVMAAQQDGRLASDHYPCPSSEHLAQLAA